MGKLVVQANCTSPDSFHGKGQYFFTVTYVAFIKYPVVEFSFVSNCHKNLDIIFVKDYLP